MSLSSYFAFAHVQASLHEVVVNGAKPVPGVQSGPSDSGVPTPHRRQWPYAHFHVNSTAALRYSLQHATHNVRISTCSLQARAEQHARSAACHMQQTIMVAAMQRMTRCMSAPAHMSIAFC
jgi:hypothetical protein